VFVKKLQERISTFKIGSGLDLTIIYSPLVNIAGVKKTKEYINDTVSKGAKLIIGGTSPDSEGYLIQPALLIGITYKMLVVREETFGPLAPVFKFDTEEDVIE
jgi:succinate-semialdehyde dehydrogenase/glutarate-semialdehyde dehydrogenase